MAGAITVSTLKNDTGVFATQNAMTGIAKAWVNFSGATINASFNVSSVTANANGDYTINFANAMPSATYAIIGTTSRVSTDAYFNIIMKNNSRTDTASLCNVIAKNSTGGLEASIPTFVAIFSS